ncbi:MAG: dodecin domain-containing protein [Methyloceanibacter sp.]|uniref:dodecin domain-containing protein n=1 Tax=Methyloceanibacter sp. TaxID=1965321 RepID=UPI003D9B43D1
MVERSRAPDAPPAQLKERAMSMLKVFEVLAESNKSWEEAAQTAVSRANASVRNAAPST